MQPSDTGVPSLFGPLPEFDVFHRKALDDPNEEGSYSTEAFLKFRDDCFNAAMSALMNFGDGDPKTLFDRAWALAPVPIPNPGGSEPWDLAGWKAACQVIFGLGALAGAKLPAAIDELPPGLSVSADAEGVWLRSHGGPSFGEALVSVNEIAEERGPLTRDILTKWIKDYKEQHRG